MIAKNTYPIKDFYGRQLGFIEEDLNGDRQVKDFQGRIKGFYNKQKNTTSDFYGRLIGTGDLLSSLLDK